MQGKDNEVKIIISVVSDAKDLDKIQKALGNVGKVATKSSKTTKDSLKAITPAMQELWQGVEKLARHWGVSWETALPYFGKMRKGLKLTEKDTYKLAAATDAAAKKMGVSWKKTYAILGKKMEVGFKGISGTKSLKEITPQMQAIWKQAQRLSQQLKIPFEKALPYARRLDKEFKILETDTIQLFQAAKKLALEKNLPFSGLVNSLRKVGVGAKKATNSVSQGANKMATNVKTATKSTNKSFDSTGNKLTVLAWHFRYLGTVFTRASQQLIRMAKDWFTVATDIEESFFSIRAATALYGQDSEEATEMAQKLAETGLVPLTVAADSLRNLLLTGIGLPEIEKLTYRYLDVASLATSGAKGLQQSFETITASIVRGSLVLSKDVAARGIWNQTNARLQKTTGMLLKDLDAQQRAMEILTTIEEDFIGTEGLHRIEMLQMGATIGRLDTAYQTLKRTLALSLRPALEFITKQFISFVKIIGNVVDFLSAPFVGAIGTVTIGFITLSGIILTLTALFISITKVWVVASSFLTALNVKTLALVVSTNASTKALILNKIAWLALKAVTWEFWVIMGAIAIVIGTVTWAIMKLKGTFGDTAKKIETTEKELEELRKTIIASGEEFRGFSNTIEDTLEKITELEKGISDKRGSYERDLARLVRKHSDSWNKAAKDVEGAKIKMEKSLATLTKSHEESVEDESFAYRRKREDIEEDIARELAKGLWADQIKIKEAQKTLKRLEEDHARSISKENKRYEDRKKSVLETYRDELDAAKESMEKINVLWQKHREEVAEGIKLMATLPDEFEEIAESFIENTKEEQKELDALNIKVDEVKKKIIELYEPLKELGRIFLMALVDPIGSLTVNAPVVLSGLKNGFIDLFKVITGGASESKTELENLQDEMSEIADIFPDYTQQPYANTTPWLGFQKGSIVPGQRNEAVPIMAHGGERIIPAGESVGSGMVTININNPTIRENEDINRIARAVSQVLGRRMQLAQMSAI